ncbi:MAG TPA: hypothetical protein VMB26_13760 [Candidatus Binataceae bacterium]|nr:hypothetical protein [Candidatus Binataceae bacterium]
MKHPSGKCLRICALALTTFFYIAILAQPNRALAQNEAAGEPWYTQWGTSLFTGSNVALLDVRSSPGWISGLSVSGYLQNTTGMWANSAALTDFGRAAGEHHGANSLSVERNLLQLDTNYFLNGDNRFFLRFWGVYEPPYPWEEHTIAGPTGAYDKSQSSFYNRYDLRDAFWSTTNGPLTLFLGRQIVTWGESIAFRVGDVVNPQDLSWNFGFANLEQSRLPLWMVHPFLNLPHLGPFGANFIEGIWTTPWQPAYTSVDYADQRYQGQYDVAGAVNLLPPGGGRFDTYPYPYTITAQAPRGVQAAFPQIRGSVSPSQSYRLPADTWANSTEGFRLHTLVENAEITALYWHAHQLNPTPFVTGTSQSVQNLQFRYPDLNDIGVTINRPIYLQGDFLSSMPFVLRSEAVWQDRTPFNTVNIARPSGVVYSSTLNTLVALDMDNVNAPWLSSTGNLTTNLEWNNYTILSPNKDMVYSGYAERWRHNEENLLFNATTSWWWGAVAPTAVGIYNPDGNTWEFFPSVVLTPPWTNKYLVSLQYIGILSNDKYSSYAGGVFKGKSIFLMQFQYNFNLIQGKS